MANTVSRILSDETLNRIIQIESAGNPNAKAPTSSAAGLGQFINGTWHAVGLKHYPAEVKAAGGEWSAMRVGTATAALQLRMLARFTEDNAVGLGPGFTDGDLYLAHFLGLGDARKLFRAPPATLASEHVTPAAVSANKSILSGKTCAEVRAWAQASMEQRWVKAGKPDWVKKYADQGVVPPPPDVEPINRPVPIPVPAPTPAPPPKSGTVGGIVGGAVVLGGGTVATATAAKKGMPTSEIAIFVGLILVIALAAFIVIRHVWRSK